MGALALPNFPPLPSGNRLPKRFGFFWGAPVSQRNVIWHCQAPGSGPTANGGGSVEAPKW